ncbi:MAG: transposase, partial [Myxococcota bacterium]
MTKKRKYRSISVNDKRLASLIETVPEGRLIVGIDIAKTRQFAALMSGDAEVHGIIRWEHPVESPRFLEVLKELHARCELEFVMEPSSTYGDAIRAALESAGYRVFRVNPKRTHDAAEVYDGVPSMHDAKSASIVAKLHLDGGSEPWPVASEHERSLRAALRVLKIYQEQFARNRNRLESLLARHWPELPRSLELGSVTLLMLLIEFGSAESVAAAPDEAR